MVSGWAEHAPLKEYELSELIAGTTGAGGVTAIASSPEQTVLVDD